MTDYCAGLLVLQRNDWNGIVTFDWTEDGGACPRREAGCVKTQRSFPVNRGQSGS